MHAWEMGAGSTDACIRAPPHKCMHLTLARQHTSLEAHMHLLGVPQWRPWTGPLCKHLPQRTAISSHVICRTYVTPLHNTWKCSHALKCSHAYQPSLCGNQTRGCHVPTFLSFGVSDMQVPKETYELNFIFSDGEFAYENNAGQVRACGLMCHRGHFLCVARDSLGSVCYTSA